MAVAREDFVNFRCCESFRTYITFPSNISDNVVESPENATG
jgi:hypothetical protein